MHGDFLADNIDSTLIGGVSMLSGYVSKVRSEEPNTLYCIAGDMFRGSIIDSEFHGISTIEIMNLLAPDVVCIGNHETDYGLSHLLFLEKCARFPIINANLHINTNGARLFEPYKLFEVDGMKILFIGILTEEVLAQTKNDSLIGTLVDIDEAAAAVGRICNTYNAIDIDMLVLLTHIGFEEDKKLAAKLDPAWGVDIIIGGHSHTYMDEPAVVNNILIVQAGTGTDQIGRFDITVDTSKNCISDYTWQCLPISAEYCPPDEDLENLILNYKNCTDRKYNRTVTRLKRRLTHPERNMETELGNLFADALKESLGVELMLLGSGSIRCKVMEPIVLYCNLAEAFPYDDPAYLIKLSGRQLHDMLVYMMRDEVWEGAHCEFYQLSEGWRVVYSREIHDLTEFTYDGEPVDDNRLYSVAMQQYHLNNIEFGLGIKPEEIEKNGKPKIISTSCREVLDEYLSSHQLLDRTAGDRIIID